MSDVNHPSHYNSGKIEVIEAIEDWKLSYHRGNAVKYLARAGKKDPAKEIEDLAKAKWYVEREIERLKARNEGREAVRPNDMNARPAALEECIPCRTGGSCIGGSECLSNNPPKPRKPVISHMAWCRGLDCSGECSKAKLSKRSGLLSTRSLRSSCAYRGAWARAKS
jgi:hypothetical protein